MDERTQVALHIAVTLPVFSLFEGPIVERTHGDMGFMRYTNWKLNLGVLCGWIEVMTFERTGGDL